MRADLLDAQAAVDRADSQIPVLQKRLIAWQRNRPYKIVVEPDPTDANWELLVAYLASHWTRSFMVMWEPSLIRREPRWICSCPLF
jgi:hypothetical protein